MNLQPKTVLMGLASIVCVGALATAQIIRLNLSQMVSRIDNAVVGTITDKQYTQVSTPLSGDLYFTTLTIAGRSLVNGQPLTVEVSYMGAEGEGVYSAEAPSADETKIGREIVAFYKWEPNMGAGFASNALYAAHGGLYTTFLNRRGATIVQGRGEGYAVEKNVLLDKLDSDISTLHQNK
ncbi:MAG: hypothetical protein GY711_30945 [bacterium]|nr:hypothetical protein [bacterium]